jgi:hypothetical protein
LLEARFLNAYPLFLFFRDLGFKGLQGGRLILPTISILAIDSQPAGLHKSLVKKKEN